MPELPEVETIARGLAARVTGEVIESVWLGNKPEPLKSPAPENVATLESSRITGVRRVGKHIVIDLQKSVGGRTAPPVKKSKRNPKVLPSAHSQWIVHLGMTGRMLVCEPEHAVE